MDVLTRFKNPVVLVLAMLALCLATLATNIAANVVSPANDFAHLAPRKISFRLGGLITGIIGMLMMPWKLVADPTGYIFTWLIAYSALLGPIGGILIADYFVCRRCKLNVTALYQADGEYRFTNGFSLVALIAFVVGALPSLPGFLVNVKVLSRRKRSAISRAALQLRVVHRFRGGVRRLSCACANLRRNFNIIYEKHPVAPDQPSTAKIHRAVRR